jgi:hypothetical protein
MLRNASDKNGKINQDQIFPALQMIKMLSKNLQLTSVTAAE